MLQLLQLFWYDDENHNDYPGTLTSNFQINLMLGEWSLNESKLAAMNLALTL